MERAELDRRLGEARVARLGTVDARGRAHLVPICFAVDGDVLYSAVDRKPKRTQALQRLANVAAEPAATVLIDHYEEAWDRLWWIRLRGRGRLVEDPAERRRALELLAARYPQYRSAPPDGPVLAIDVDERRAWSAT